MFLGHLYMFWQKKYSQGILVCISGYFDKRNVHRVFWCVLQSILACNEAVGSRLMVTNMSAPQHGLTIASCSSSTDKHIQKTMTKWQNYKITKLQNVKITKLQNVKITKTNIIVPPHVHTIASCSSRMDKYHNWTLVSLCVSNYKQHKNLQNHWFRQQDLKTFNTMQTT